MKNRTGEKHITKEGYEIEIIEYFNRRNCTIQFKNEVILKKKSYSSILNGTIRNPYHISFFGKGYKGECNDREYVKVNLTRIESIWNNILVRCYSEDYRSKKNAYKDVTVCEEWHNFQNFAKWYEENYIEGFQLDKDILVKGNKIYSPENCCFVPQEINKLFTKSDSSRGDLPIGVRVTKNKKYQARVTKNNTSCYLGTFNTVEEAFQAYKVAKEEYIKEVADRWKGQITEEVYHAMYNYQVKITD